MLFAIGLRGEIMDMYRRPKTNDEIYNEWKQYLQARKIIKEGMSE